jgi:hypothetical protein
MKAKIENSLFILMVAGFIGLMLSIVLYSHGFALLSGGLILLSITINLMVKVLQTSKK